MTAVAADPTEFPFPSVTVTVTAYVPEADGVQLKETTFPGGAHPVGNPDQAYVYGVAPPVAPVVEIVIVCPASAGFGFTVTSPALNAWSTTSVSAPVTRLPFVSVTVNVTVYVPATDGTQLNDSTLPGVEHPVGNPDHV